MGQNMMKTFTTKKAVKLVRRELEQRGRQSDLVVVENESGTIQIEATSDEVEDFERLANTPIDSDIIADELMSSLLGHLEAEELLESAKVAPTSA
jgi:hypothetical protein